MEEHLEWEKARQVVEAIQRTLVGGGDDGDGLTTENPVSESSSMSGSGPVKTETKVKRAKDFDYEKRIAELIRQKKQVDIQGAAAVEALKKKWAGGANG
jgi:hypothetical protein